MTKNRNDIVGARKMAGLRVLGNLSENRCSQRQRNEWVFQVSMHTNICTKRNTTFFCLFVRNGIGLEWRGRWEKDGIFKSRE